MSAPMREDTGATLILVALTLFVLLGASAIAVDLAALRVDRTADQKVTDSAASAGAIAVVEGGAGQEACEATLAYAAINVEELSSLNDSGCATAFSAICDALVAESHTVTAGRFTITVTYPVPDAHPLMTSGILTAPTQGIVAEDGLACERVAVQISAVRRGLFAQILGWDQGTTTVHTVAIGDIPSGGGVPVNLLVLDRFGCEAIDVQGNGGIIVRSVVNEAGTGLQAGIAAADSDGSAPCISDGVIDVDGSNSVLRADGPAGCPNQTGTSTVGGFISGHGCGRIQTLADNPGGVCSPPACTNPGNPGNPNPFPTALPGRLTRAPIDHRYNCWADYTALPPGVSWATDPLTVANEQDIPGCTGAPDHIYDLINAVGQNGSAGFTRWTTLGHPCDIDSSYGPINVPGNVHVDCPGGLVVRVPVTIVGNVIFDGDVGVTGATSHLNLANTLGSPGWAFFRGGEFRKDGQAQLTIDYTTVYMSKTSRIEMAGGSGALRWVAPNSGNFDDLALWSDSPQLHQWAGQAVLTMEGVFFTPRATSEYAGTGGQNQTEAQWVADKLVARGQGALEILPAFGRAVEFPLAAQSTLIR